MSVKEKWIHAVTALAFVALFGGVWYKFPVLMAGPQAVFSTISGFVSLYGLTFAIVELLRTRAVAEKVKSETDKALTRVENLADLKLLSDCQANVEQAIQFIEMKLVVPIALLTQINKVYSQHFHADIHNASKPQAKNVAVIRTYTASQRSKPSKNYYDNLGMTLALITTELASEIALKGKLGNRS